MSKPLVSVKALRKNYLTEAGELEVLKGIDLEIQRAEMVAVVGASGVGKSTLLHILGTLDRPTSGQVLFDGVDVFGLNDPELAEFRNRKIGFVFQFHHLLPEFSALENVMMPALIGGMERDEAIVRAEGLLSELGLSERLQHRPGELSGGEQQRVAVARALVMEPSLVLADEPTGNLDTRTGRELFCLLKKLNSERGITFLVVTHNEELASGCSRVVKMVDGRFEGSFS
ncbi:MAG: ABC transporter ATP-binding protein [Nitrospirae bacterium]|nr:MAG: ABC transporter ATP-binding protein [Nitrospirota bacterium]